MYIEPNTIITSWLVTQYTIFFFLEVAPEYKLHQSKMRHEEEKTYKLYWTISRIHLDFFSLKIQDQEQTFNLERKVIELHDSTQNNRLTRCPVC